VGQRISTNLESVAKSATGKLVSKVGASGGGKAYKKSRPINYYGILVVIVVLGLSSVVLARYDYQNPTAAPAGTPPAIGTTWFAASTFDICGSNSSLLIPNPVSKGGFSILSNGVIRISPVSDADAGNHATVSQFANEYPGFIASSSELAIPVTNGKATAATTFHNGELCPKKSAYPNKPAVIEYAYWSNFGQKTPTIVTDPAKIKFSNLMELTMAVLPKGAVPARPSTAAIAAMVKLNTATSATTTTTTLPGTTSTVPVTSTTVVNVTTTTVKSTTTTVAQG